MKAWKDDRVDYTTELCGKRENQMEAAYSHSRQVFKRIKNENLFAAYILF